GSEDDALTRLGPEEIGEFARLLGRIAGVGYRDARRRALLRAIRLGPRIRPTAGVGREDHAGGDARERRGNRGKPGPDRTAAPGYLCRGGPVGGGRAGGGQAPRRPSLRPDPAHDPGLAIAVHRCEGVAEGSRVGESVARVLPQAAL